MNYPQAVFIICVIAFFLNLPFGWFRTYTKKFSIPWFVCIHAPIPIVAVIRIYTDTDFIYIPIFLIFSLAGQIIGARIKKRRA